MPGRLLLRQVGIGTGRGCHDGVLLPLGGLIDASARSFDPLTCVPFMHCLMPLAGDADRDMSPMVVLVRTAAAAPAWHWDRPWVP